jgi:hypothetical protein
MGNRMVKEKFDMSKEKVCYMNAGGLLVTWDFTGASIPNMTVTISMVDTPEYTAQILNQNGTVDGIQDGVRGNYQLFSEWMLKINKRDGKYVVDGSKYTVKGTIGTREFPQVSLNCLEIVEKDEYFKIKVETNDNFPGGTYVIANKDNKYISGMEYYRLNFQ